MAAFMPMSKLLKSSQLDDLIESQNRISNSLSAFSSISSILQQVAIPKIPDSTIIALQGIISLQSMHYVETLKSIQNATSISKLINPTFETHKLSNLNTALNSLTSQLTQLASNNNDWEILDDYQSFVNDAVQFSDIVIENDEKQIEIYLKLLFERFTFFYQKHKQATIIIYKFLETILMFTTIQQ